jgi:hypothetical protein
MVRIPHFIGVACLILQFGVSVELFAQTPSGPPGFVPDQTDDTTPSLAQPPRTYTGSINNGFSVATPYPNSAIGARPYNLQDPATTRVFTQPSSPILILDAEPAMPTIWFKAEALYWWSKSSPVPVPIVTQGNTNDAVPGAIGQPGTTVLIGNQNINIPGRGGSRYTLGFAFDPAQIWGFEASYFSLATASVTEGVYSNGGPGSTLLAFPFFNPNTSTQDSSAISYPGSFPGGAVLNLQSILQGVDLNFVHNVSNSEGVRFDLIGGFRYVNFQEGLFFNTSSPSYGPVYHGYFNTYDQFTTYNNFYGGQFGLRASYDVARFYFNATTKLAMGATWENVSINGGTYTNIGGFASAAGGYLSQPTNIGSQTREQFTVIPEMNLNIGFRIRPWASIFVGYSFLYISSVARPGNQIDPVINPSQSPAISYTFPGNLVGTPRPEPSVHTTDFWAQGLNLGLEFRY